MSDLGPYRSLRAVSLIRHMLRSWWRLELAFANSKGYVLDHADGNIFPSGNEFCRLSLFSKDGFRCCNDSVKIVRDRLRSESSRPRSGRGKSKPKSLPTHPDPSLPKSLIIHECHLGFDIIAAPIHFEGDLAGFLFTGGAYHGEPSASAKLELASKIRELCSLGDEDVERYVACVPRLSDADLRYLADLLQYGAHEIMRVHAERTRRRPPAATASPDCSAERYGEIVGNASSMIEVYQLLDRIVPSNCTVLIQGESGTGKELIARAIHYSGPRADKPFVVQNCSAFNDNLLESSLFGHIRGAFTGAVKDHKGLFELADRGTFFLDEIGDMSPALQVKLLRVLQEGTFTPVGASKENQVDVRIIAASHKDLADLVARGLFREDLYYRINVLKITVPPLRERIEDVPTLAQHFLCKHHRGEGEPPVLSAAALQAMSKYAWPGNIRELENEIERLIVLSAGAYEIGAELLSPQIRDVRPAPLSSLVHRLEDPIGAHAGTLREVVERVEAAIIGQGLIRTHWNKSQLAKELGISRSNLNQKCNQYGLERKEP